MTSSRLLRTLAASALALTLLACGGDDGDDDEDAAEGTTSTTAAEAEETTTTEDSLFTGTTASTADDETTTTAPPATSPPTQPPTTRPPVTTPTTAPGPRVDSISVSEACDENGQATLSWSTTGAVSVEISIDNENGTFQSGLPADGSGQFPGACGGDEQVYFVKAIAADGRTATDSERVTS